MNGDVSQLATLTGVSVAINGVYAIQHKSNAVVTVVAGGFLFLGLVLIGGITGRYDLARALAVVFLLASALLHGVSLVDSVTKTTKGATSRPNIVAAATAQANAAATAAANAIRNPAVATPRTGNVVS